SADILLVAPAAVEAALVARRLMAWGARTCTVPDEKVAAALAGERSWRAILVDRALGREASEGLAGMSAIARRIALIKPAERHEWPALQAAGFTDYLVKPVRAASLAARLGTRAEGFTPTGEDEVTPGIAAAVKTASGLAILIAEDNE